MGLIRGLSSRLPSYLHDYQFWSGECSLWTANNNIRKAVIDTGGGRYTATKVWVGLYFGGWIAWNRYKRLRVENGQNYLIDLHTAKTLEEAEKIAMLGDV